MHRVVVDEENMMKSEIILALRHINEHMVSMYLDDKYLVTESLEVHDAGLLGALEQHGPSNIWPMLSSTTTITAVTASAAEHHGHRPREVEEWDYGRMGGASLCNALHPLPTNPRWIRLRSSGRKCRERESATSLVSGGGGSELGRDKVEPTSALHSSVRSHGRRACRVTWRRAKA